MSLRLRPGHRIFVYREYVDMRFGYNKLSMFVREKVQAEIVEGDLFLFLGKNRNLLKGICYDGTGLILISKRMEHGKFMRIEELEESAITEDELHLLLHGSTIRRTKFGQAALTRAADSPTLNSDETARTGAESGSAQAVRPSSRRHG